MFYPSDRERMQNRKKNRPTSKSVLPLCMGGATKAGFGCKVNVPWYCLSLPSLLRPSYSQSTAIVIICLLLNGLLTSHSLSHSLSLSLYIYCSSSYRDLLLVTSKSVTHRYLAVWHCHSATSSGWNDETVVALPATDYTVRMVTRSCFRIFLAIYI